MTRSETKFQAPLNRRYQEVLAKTEHLSISQQVMRGMDYYVMTARAFGFEAIDVI